LILKLLMTAYLYSFAVFRIAASNANRLYLRLVVASPEYQAGLVER
jgi:hypothetical protein